MVFQVRILFETSPTERAYESALFIALVAYVSQQVASMFVLLSALDAVVKRQVLNRN